MAGDEAGVAMLGRGRQMQVDSGKRRRLFTEGVIESIEKGKEWNEEKIHI